MDQVLVNEVQGRAQHCTSELDEMIENEKSTRRTTDHFRLLRLRNKCTPSRLWRERVVQWFYDVVDHVEEPRETVFIAANVLDRFIVVDNANPITERHYEAAALTALFLAVRISGNASLEVFDVIRMSRNGIRVQEIVECGKQMTLHLSWERRVLTPTEFVKAAVNLLPASLDMAVKTEIIDGASHLVEVSVCDTFFVGMKPSMIAFAALMITIHKRTECIGVSVCNSFSEMVAKSFGTSTTDKGLNLVRNRLLQVHDASVESRRPHPHVIPDSDDADDLNFCGAGLSTQRPGSAKRIAVTIDPICPSPQQLDKCSLLKRPVSLALQATTKRRKISADTD